MLGEEVRLQALYSVGWYAENDILIYILIAVACNCTTQNSAKQNSHQKEKMK